MSNRRDRMDHIHACDGLRAIALMGVIAFHVWPNKVPGGYFGVNIFFVLAGFLSVARSIMNCNGIINLTCSSITGNVSCGYTCR